MKDQQKAQVIKLMRKMIDGEVENKEVGWLVEEQTHNSAISAADCYSIINDIEEGSSSCQRNGDRIKPKSLVVRGVVSLNPAMNPDTKPIIVRVIIATQKDIKKAGGTVGNVDTAHLLRPATAGAEEVPFTGKRLELTYPVNNNKFRVYMDKTFLLCPTSAASGFPLERSQFVFNKRFKKLPAKLTYDAGNGDYNNNFAPFIAIGYAYADNTAPDVATLRVSTSVHSILTYEDA